MTVLEWFFVLLAGLIVMGFFGYIVWKFADWNVLISLETTKTKEGCQKLVKWCKIAAKAYLTWTFAAALCLVASVVFLLMYYPWPFVPHLAQYWTVGLLACGALGVCAGVIVNLCSDYYDYPFDDSYQGSFSLLSCILVGIFFLFCAVIIFAVGLFVKFPQVMLYIVAISFLVIFWGKITYDVVNCRGKKVRHQR